MPDFPPLPPFVADGGDPTDECLRLPVPFADGQTRVLQFKPRTAGQALLVRRLAVVEINRKHGWPSAPSDLAAVESLSAEDQYAAVLGADNAKLIAEHDLDERVFHKVLRTVNRWHETLCDSDAALAEWTGKAPAAGTQTRSGKGGAVANASQTAAGSTTTPTKN